MAISRRRLLSLFLLCAFSSLPAQAAARGGSHPSGTGGNYGSFLRNLLQDNPMVTEELIHGYMSNSELEIAVHAIGSRCPNISRIYSIGKSVNGVTLWVIEISDKPGQKEAEPAFKYVGNVHGDEPVGREVLIKLANWLCDNYLKDPLATLIVENMHLHILPTMNPDGFALRRRGNANNVDLNRDFPDQFFPINDEINYRQPETRAIMNWVKQEHFTASASLHGGALVANYPWDGSRDQRYPIYGGMQDWNYIHGGCFELTLEVSDVKWPKSAELPVIWEHNRMSMLNLAASLVKTGVHGRIFAADTGHPIPGSLTIKGIDSEIRASRTYGDYHRMLAPGENYEVMASMEGFRTKATRIVVDEKAVSLDFILDRDGANGQVIRNDLDYPCDHDKLFHVQGARLELYLFVLLIIIALYVLFKRKTTSKFTTHRHSPKRPIAV
uniref:Peptidase M14 domain-containing protein n=1 Tax=Oryza punctata TaxID=4537 RepID=A0A0E0L7Q0_ORYPU